jgi:hypothetical protein
MLMLRVFNGVGENINELLVVYFSRIGNENCIKVVQNHGIFLHVTRHAKY